MEGIDEIDDWPLHLMIDVAVITIIQNKNYQYWSISNSNLIGHKWDWLVSQYKNFNLLVSGILDRLSGRDYLI